MSPWRPARHAREVCSGGTVARGAIAAHNSRGPGAAPHEMSATDLRAVKRTPRSQALGLALLVLAYVTQPALALASFRCADQGCGPVPARCCCVGGTEIATPAAPERGCCMSEDPGATTPGGPSLRECKCRVDSTPFPAPGPVLPPKGSDPSGHGSATDWIRVHAELFACLPSGPPGGASPPWECPGSTVGARPPDRVGDPVLRQVASVGAWKLLARGAIGFLAVLSVARL